MYRQSASAKLRAGRAFDLEDDLEFCPLFIPSVRKQQDPMAMLRMMTSGNVNRSSPTFKLSYRKP
ncbi:Hypothetical protein PP7435_CHR1-2181 [Komagataella phaffii CBS 7435]|uniref:Uncharacterized protein n=2 Tax=Komagataella phaffii TaxID=460519 RepID=C4QWI7_KOMPG|nr:Hypothetical protein PAS_chr1-1_0240 [Komagataella phaffii GS115]CAH2446301.1 Hypothetical protein BQ9382_C1-2858 [Komagataella phaffii CBS 7435]CAY67610.1 Hypothetical protein PAS_chr1-1_0240 [Komagataella phaffii GS115]SCV11817.1 Hypothetical protein PP7435_CHR1-2181 [Komagataella phaffii CBS 7435]